MDKYHYDLIPKILRKLRQWKTVIGQVKQTVYAVTDLQIKVEHSGSVIFEFLLEVWWDVSDPQVVPGQTKVTVSLSRSWFFRQWQNDHFCAVLCSWNSQIPLQGLVNPDHLRTFPKTRTIVFMANTYFHKKKPQKTERNSSLSSWIRSMFVMY